MTLRCCKASGLRGDPSTSRRADKQTNDRTDKRPNRQTTEQTNDTRAKMEVVDIGQRTEGRKSCYDVFIE